VALVDAALPVSHWLWAGNDVQPWHVLCLKLPRATLVSHLGFQPNGGIIGRAGSPARLSPPCRLARSSKVPSTLCREDARHASRSHTPKVEWSTKSVLDRSATEL
jgi:hypothetical protein